MDPVARPAWPFLVTFLVELPCDLSLADGTTLPAYERAEDLESSPFRLPGDTPDGLTVGTRFVFRRSRRKDSRRRTVALEVFEDFWDGMRFVDSNPARKTIEGKVPVTVVAVTTATTR